MKKTPIEAVRNTNMKKKETLVDVRGSVLHPGYLVRSDKHDNICKEEHVHEASPNKT